MRAQFSDKLLGSVAVAIQVLLIQIKKGQQKIEMILDSKKIEYTKVDVAADEAAKAKMRDLSGNSAAIPPQLFNGDQYCGVCTSQCLCIIHLFLCTHT